MVICWEVLVTMFIQVGVIFVNDETPKAFAITHSNSPDMSQFLAELKFQQYSLYLQDEVSVSENFKVTGGLRF